MKIKSITTTTLELNDRELELIRSALYDKSLSVQLDGRECLELSYLVDEIDGNNAF